jgi:hypothetical protein
VDGTPVPDGMAFTLSATWPGGGGAQYTATSSGGNLSFPLSLPTSTVKQAVALTLSRPADLQYLAAKSAELRVKVARPVVRPQPKPHLRHKCRKGFKKHKIHGKARCVRVKKKGHGRHVASRPLAAVFEAGDSLRQQCIQAALVMPKAKRAYIAHPGDRPFEHDSSEVGAVQTTNVALLYPAVPPECAPITKRLGRAKLQKQVGKKWITYAGFHESGLGYASNDAGGDSSVRMEAGHGEPDEAYWHPGERFRLVLKNFVRNPQTGAVLDTKTKLVPIPIRGK